MHSPFTKVAPEREATPWRKALARGRETCFTASRAALDLLLRALGVLNVAPLVARGNDAPPTIVFQSFSTHLAQCYEPIIARLRADAPHVRVQFMLLLHPHLPLRELRALRRYVRDELRIADADVFFHWQSLWRSFDLLVCGDIFARFPVRRSRTVLVPHGTGLMPRMFEPHPLRKSMADFDRVLLAGPYDVDAVRDHPRRDGLLSRVVAVGFPFLDRLRSPALSRDEYCARLDLDPAKRIVLFAPHWTGLRASGAVAYVQDVVHALTPLDANLIVKLHTCSSFPAMAGGVAWTPILDRLGRDPRVHVDREVDDLLALGYADVLVTDFSSRAFVFMALEKPVVLHSPAGADPVEERDARMILMRSGSYPEQSSAEVATRVGRLLQDYAPHPSGRAVSARCFSNLLHATKPAVDVLLDELGS